MKEPKDFIVACDMDDTIEYLVQAWVRWLNNKYELSVQYEDIKHWEMQLAFPTLTKEQIFEPLTIVDFWRTVEPMPQAVKYIKKLIDDGFTFYICTASHYRALEVKMDEVLFKHFPYLSWSNVIVMQNKQMLKCDILIDDAAHNIVGEYIGLLKDAPYNKSFNESEHVSVLRVHTWKEIYNRVHEIYNLAKDH